MRSQRPHSKWYAQRKRIFHFAHLWWRMKLNRVIHHIMLMQFIFFSLNNETIQFKCANEQWWINKQHEKKIHNDDLYAGFKCMNYANADRQNTLNKSSLGMIHIAMTVEYSPSQPPFITDNLLLLTTWHTLRTQFLTTHHFEHHNRLFIKIKMISLVIHVGNCSCSLAFFFLLFLVCLCIQIQTLSHLNW